MPTQPKLPTHSDHTIIWLRFRNTTSVTSRVFKRKYRTANSTDEMSSTPSLYRCCDLSVAVSAVNSVPATNIDSAAISGLAMRLVQRVDVRIAPTPASPAEASAAAAGPCISSSRKMNISPAANELFERGIFTGKAPAIIATAMPTASCSVAPAGSDATRISESPTLAAPSATTAHQ